MRILAWPAHKFRGENPYSSLLYRRMERLGVEVDEFSVTRLLAGRYDIWHIHWPEHFLNKADSAQAYLKSCALPALMDAAHALGTRIVWTAHNVYTHERIRPKLEEFFWNQFTRRLDGFISLSKCGVELLLSRHPALRKVPGFAIPHGHYRGEYPMVYTRSEALQVLGIDSDGPIILNFGAIRPYKGIPELLRAFKEIPNPAARLLVVGSCSSRDLELTIRRGASDDARVRLLLQAVPPPQVQLYFAAADVAVLPYKEILNSGTALLAVSLERPVCVPGVDSMMELQQMLGNDWMRTYTGEFGSAVLQDAIDWSLGPRPTKPCLDEFNWDNIAAITAAVYRDLTGNSHTVQIASPA